MRYVFICAMAPVEIKELRERLGWAQHEMAAHLGITQASVSRIESGAQEPSRPLLKLLALLHEQEAEKPAEAAE